MKPFITGTRAFGPVREDSDIDVVMMQKDAKLFKAFLESVGISVRMEDKPGYQDGNYYFAMNEGPETNVIVMDTKWKFAHWLYATEEMKKIDPISDRCDRILKFVALIQESEKRRTADAR